ncbi:hypothetical protein H311_00622 [Anncaliia algerae PRA109]|nr:hypothetical protein H311_00622 [Anncaliia algerae PRA109]
MGSWRHRFRNKRMIFVEVVDRNADTLKYIILENVEPGSLIITDEWRGY